MNKRMLSKNRAMLVIIAILSMAIIASVAVIVAIATSGPSAHVAKYQITTDGKVNLKFKYDSVDDEVAGFKAELDGVEFPELLYAKDDGTYKVVTVSLNPDEMAKEVTVYPVDAEGNKGDGTTFSVVKYAEKFLATSNDEDQKDAMRALLNYGAYSEIYFGGALTGMANQGVFIKDTDPIRAVTNIDCATHTSYFGEGFLQAGSEVKLDLGDNDIALNFSIKYTGASADDLKLSVVRTDLVNGNQELVELANELAVSYDPENQLCNFSIGNISVKLFNEVYTVVLSDGNDNFTRELSVLEYLKSLFEAQSTDEDVKNIVASLYQYYQVANKTTDKENCEHSSFYYINEGRKCGKCFKLMPEANVILWSGQSNAYGASPVTSEMKAEAAKRDFSNVYIHYSNINLRNGTDWEEFSGNDSFEQFALGEDGDGSLSFSPLFGTVCHLIDNGYVSEDKPLYIIKYAAAQTVLNSQWFPTNAANPQDPGSLMEDLGGYLADLMNDFIDVSLKELEKEYNPVIQAFVWIQGESDGQSRENIASGYKPQEQALVSGIRSRYSSYAGENGITFIDYAIKERATDKVWWKYASIVNKAKEENARYYFDVDAAFASDGTLPLTYVENATPGIDNSVLIAVEDFVKAKVEVGESDTDGAHFSSQSAYKLGRIIGRVYRNALGETTVDDPAVSGICPALGSSMTDHYQSDEDGHWIAAGCDACGTTVKEKEAHIVTEYTVPDADDYNAEGHIANGNCDICGLEVTARVPHNISQEKTVDGAYTKYTFTCNDCNYSSDKTVLSSVEFYSAPDLYNFPAEGLSNYQIKEGMNGLYYRLTGIGNYASEIFIRSPLDSGDGINNDYGNINVGNAKYVVVKIKGKSAVYPTLNFSTLEVNRYTDAQHSGETSYGTNYQSGVVLAVTEEWQTFVFDASELLATYYKQTDGAYIIDTWMVVVGSFASNEYLDIEYIAFAENWSEIADVVDEESVRLISNKNGTSAESDLSGVCAHKNADCNDTICDLCGEDCGFTGDGHLNSNNDSICDSCGEAVTEVPGAYVLNGQTLADRNSQVNCTETVDAEGFIRLTASNASNLTSALYMLRDELDHSTGDSKNKNHINVGAATYMVLKMRTSSTKTSHTMYLSTEAASSTDPAAAAGRDGYTVITIKDIGAEWTYYVIDLAKVAPKQYKPNANGNHVIDTFWIYFDNDSVGTAVDIDYIAFAENWSEIKDLVGEETTLSNITNTTGTIANVTSSGSCVGAHSATFTESVDGNVYSYACSACSTVMKTVTFPTGTVVMSSNTLYNAGKGDFRGVASFVGGNYRLTGDGQGSNLHVWVREQYYTNEANKTNGNLTGGGNNGSGMSNIDIGNAKYMVVRLKNTSETNDPMFYVSTTGWNYDTDGCTGIGIDVVAKKITVDTSEYAGEWKTYVIDLAAVLGTCYAKDSETGTYVIDTLYMQMSGEFASTDYVEIAYFAFAENWLQIDAMTEENGIMYYANGTTSSELLLTDKVRKDNMILAEDLAYNSSKKPVTSGNTVLNGKFELSEDKSTITVTSRATAANNLVLSLWLREPYKSSNGTGTYSSGGSYIPETYIDIGESEYMIVKAKTTGISRFQFCMSTTVLNYDSEGVNGNIYNCIQNVNFIPGSEDWTVFVIDLKLLNSSKTMFGKDPVTGTYVIDNLYMQFTSLDPATVPTQSVEFEYIAFADSRSEINTLVGEDVESVKYITSVGGTTSDVAPETMQ